MHAFAAAHNDYTACVAAISSRKPRTKSENRHPACRLALLASSLRRDFHSQENLIVRGLIYVCDYNADLMRAIAGQCVLPTAASS
eukprot:scaffold647840_cov34-Prasinocladus_malaysianus.AAC.1